MKFLILFFMAMIGFNVMADEPPHQPQTYTYTTRYKAYVLFEKVCKDAKGEPVNGYLQAFQLLPIQKGGKIPLCWQAVGNSVTVTDFANVWEVIHYNNLINVTAQDKRYIGG
jgi:hypothetical protein